MPLPRPPHARGSVRRIGACVCCLRQPRPDRRLVNRLVICETGLAVGQLKEESMRTCLVSAGPGPSTLRSVACCFIAPPDLLARLADEGTKEQRAAALSTLAASASIRARRALIGQLLRDPQTRQAALAFFGAPAAVGVRRRVYDVHNGGQSALPGKLARAEDDPP